MSKVMRLDPACWSSLVTLASDILRGNGVIAVPTDTVYGVASLAQSETAVQKLYDVKGRSATKPIAISVADVSDVYRWGAVTVSDILLHELLPGPVTVVFERTLALNPELNPGTSLVGIRVPDSGFVRDISRRCGEPLALTSANVSNLPSSLSAEEFSELWSRLDCVFDGGLLGTSVLSKQGSTVVDLSKRGLFTIIRDGSALDDTVSKLLRHGLRKDRKC